MIYSIVYQSIASYRTSGSISTSVLCAWVTIHIIYNMYPDLWYCHNNFKRTEYSIYAIYRSIFLHLIHTVCLIKWRYLITSLAISTCLVHTYVHMHCSTSLGVDYIRTSTGFLSKNTKIIRWASLLNTNSCLLPYLLGEKCFWAHWALLVVFLQFKVFYI